MHKSLETYSAALKCTAGQVRRYITAGHVPSAVLVKGAKGRPYWMIRDTSAETIDGLRRKIRWSGCELPIFHEPVRHRQIGVMPGRGPFVSDLLLWQPMFRRRERNPTSVGYDIIYRFALLRHGLTVNELRNPPTFRDPDYMNRMLPEHERKVKGFEKTLHRLTLAMLAPAIAKRNMLVQAIINREFQSAELKQAADYLGSYHRQQGIEITYATLGWVLGLSKSALYRRFRAAEIREALALAYKNARTPLRRERPPRGGKFSGIAPETERASLNPEQRVQQSRRDEADDRDFIAALFDNNTYRVPRNVSETFIMRPWRRRRGCPHPAVSPQSTRDDKLHWWLNFGRCEHGVVF